MTVIELFSKDFDLQSIDTSRVNIGKYGVLLIKWQSCHFCKIYTPEFENLSAANPDGTFMFIDIVHPDNEHFIRNQWKEIVSPKFVVEGYPTVVLYGQNGHPIEKVEPRDILQKRINELF